MRPNGPSGSAHPDAPSRPNGPVKPDSPNASVRPDASAQPNGPAGPHGYARPDAPGSMRPDGPGRPNGSTRPDSANGPVRPDSPNGPARPGAPNAPAHPDDPVRNGRFNGSEMPRQRQPEAPSRVNDPANPRQHPTPQGVYPGTPHAPRFAAPHGLDAPHAPRLDAPHVDAPRVNHPQAAVRHPDTDRYKWADVKHEDFAHVKGEGFRHWGPGWQQRVAEDARIRAESLGYHQPDRPHAPEPAPEAPPRSTSESMATERPPENPFEHRWNNGILEHKGVDVSPELREKLGGKYTGIRNTDSGLSMIRHSRQGYYGSADFAQRMPRPSVDPKRFTVEVHGSPNGVSFNGKELSAKELAEIIKGAPGYKEGAPVRLLSCQTGADLPDGSPNFAQQLSKELGVEVLAPNKDAWVDNFGNMYASGSRAEFHPDASGTPQPRFDEPGEWVSFSPDGTKAVHESPFPPGHEPEWTRFGHQADAAHQRGLGEFLGKLFGGKEKPDSFEADPVTGETYGPPHRAYSQTPQNWQQPTHQSPGGQQSHLPPEWRQPQAQATPQLQMPGPHAQQPSGYQPHHAQPQGGHPQQPSQRGQQQGPNHPQGTPQHQQGGPNYPQGGPQHPQGGGYPQHPQQGGMHQQPPGQPHPPAAQPPRGPQQLGPNHSPAAQTARGPQQTQGMPHQGGRPTFHSPGPQGPQAPRAPHAPGQQAPRPHDVSGPHQNPPGPTHPAPRPNVGGPRLDGPPPRQGNTPPLDVSGPRPTPPTGRTDGGFGPIGSQAFEPPSPRTNSPEPTSGPGASRQNAELPRSSRRPLDWEVSDDGEFDLFEHESRGQVPGEPTLSRDASQDVGDSTSASNTRDPDPSVAERRPHMDDVSDAERCLQEKIAGEPSKMESATFGGSIDIDPYHVEFPNGAEGLYKIYYDDPYMDWRDQPSREIAASRLAEVLGWDDLVPTVTPWEGPKGAGSISEWVKDSRDGHENVADYALGERQRAAIFDYIVANTDRHGGNHIIAPDGQLKLIDHGNAFPADNTRPIKSEFVLENLNVALSDGVLSGLRAINLQYVADRLRSAGLSEKEIGGALSRLLEVRDQGKITGETWGGRI